VIEPVKLWRADPVDPVLGDADVRVSDDRIGVSVLGRPVSVPRLDFLAADSYRSCFANALSAGFSSEAQLADMDREGVDAALLFPTSGMYAIWADHIDTETSAALCRRYNDWLKSYCSAAPARLKGVALLPLQDVKASIAELRRAVEQDGHVAFVMRPNPLVARRLHDPSYDALYAAAEELGVPILVKEAIGSLLPTMGQRYRDSIFHTKAVVEPFEILLAFLSFFGANVAERFPGLRVGFIGAGAGWLAYWLERHEEHWGAMPWGLDCASTSPADLLFPEQGFVAMDPWESTVVDVAADVDVGCLVWGSHYPQPDAMGAFPDAVDKLLRAEGLPEDAKRKVLWENAARLFRLREAGT